MLVLANVAITRRGLMVNRQDAQFVIQFCWVCEVFVEGIGYAFVGVVNGIIEFYGTVWIGGGGEFVV